MNKFLSFLFSSRLMAIVILVFAISIACATFIENDYGTDTARALVYNAKWFEILLFLGIINLLGTIIISKLYKKEKLSIFIFHAAFVFILFGAAITRFTSIEGIIHLRQGEYSNKIISDRKYFQAEIENEGKKTQFEKAVYVSVKSNNQLNFRTDINKKEFKLICEIAPQSLNGDQRSIRSYILKLKLTYGDSSQINYFSSENNFLNPSQLYIIDNLKIKINLGPKEFELPFYLGLDKFIIEHYPGSKSPSWFESQVSLSDSSKNYFQRHRIYMNNILRYGQYKFYQTSYDLDEKGSLLTVNNDYWGTLVSYFGYFLLFAGMIWSLFNKNSRFRKLAINLKNLQVAKNITTVIALTFILSLSTNAQEQQVPKIDIKEAEAFGSLLIQDQGGRIKPVNSLSSELLRKISRKQEFLNQTADQVFLGMLVYPDFWQKQAMIKLGHDEIKTILKIHESYASFQDFFNIADPQHQYILEPFVKTAFQKKPASRSKFDNEILRTDERVNLCYLIYAGNFLKILPSPKDPTLPWHTPLNAGAGLDPKDSAMFAMVLPLYFQTLRKADTNNQLSGNLLNAIKDYQKRYAGNIIPSEQKMKIEIFYNKLFIFDRIASFYAIFGFILLILQFFSTFKPELKFIKIKKAIFTIIISIFIIHIAGLGFRWYISGHAPWSNGYESLLYIAFATVLAGLVFSKKSGFTLAISSLMAWLILYVAHLSWMDPEITPLVPVLKSYWLLIHVAIITASYGFLAIGALMAFTNLGLMAALTNKNSQRIHIAISELSYITEMSLIIGLYLLTIGTFLGGIWANESWGRYWAWDPKETWALISVLIYAFVAHMRLIPKLKSIYLFNLFSVLAFASIIMTYFGVNYYLSGLHSYAKDDPIPVPSFIYYTIAAIAIVSFLACHKHKRYLK